MKLISLHVKKEIQDKYKNLSKEPAAQEYLKNIRPNAGYSELMRLALSLALPKIQEQFTTNPTTTE